MQTSYLVFHLYGFFIGLGILVGVWVSEKVRKNWSIGRLVNWSIYDLLPWVLIPGILGARVYHVLDYWGYYSQDWQKIFYLWEGGLGIFGAIFGGLLGLVIWVWQLPASQFKERLTFFLSLLDLVAFGLPIGQAIGRLGNYFNQELYGLPTTLPWGLAIQPENRLPGFETFSKFHPLFAYEAIWDLIIFIILMTILKSKVTLRQAQCDTEPSQVPAGTWRSRSIKSQKLLNLKPGSLFFVYLGLYAFGRFWLEYLRIESWQIGAIKVAQALSLILIIISLGWFCLNKSKNN